MQGLTEQEVSGYIAEQMKRAGREEAVFREEAIQWAAKASHGIPRLLGSLCLAALIDAATRRDLQVELAHMERAWMEVSDQ